MFTWRACCHTSVFMTLDMLIEEHRPHDRTGAGTSMDAVYVCLTHRERERERHYIFSSHLRADQMWIPPNVDTC